MDIRKRYSGTKKPPLRSGHTTLLIIDFIDISNMVPGAGLEPAQPYSRGILNQALLEVKSTQYARFS